MYFESRGKRLRRDALAVRLINTYTTNPASQMERGEVVDNRSLPLRLRFDLPNFVQKPWYVIRGIIGPRYRKFACAAPGRSSVQRIRRGINATEEVGGNADHFLNENQVLHACRRPLVFQHKHGLLGVQPQNTASCYLMIQPVSLLTHQHSQRVVVADANHSMLTGHNAPGTALLRGIGMRLSIDTTVQINHLPTASPSRNLCRIAILVFAVETTDHATHTGRCHRRK